MSEKKKKESYFLCKGLEGRWAGANTETLESGKEDDKRQASCAVWRYSSQNGPFGIVLTLSWRIAI